MLQDHAECSRGQTHVFGLSVGKLGGLTMPKSNDVTQIAAEYVAGDPLHFSVTVKEEPEDDDCQHTGSRVAGSCECLPDVKEEEIVMDDVAITGVDVPKNFCPCPGVKEEPEDDVTTQRGSSGGIPIQLAVNHVKEEWIDDVIPNDAVDPLRHFTGKDEIDVTKQTGEFSSMEEALAGPSGLGKMEFEVEEKAGAEGSDYSGPTGNIIMFTKRRKHDLRIPYSCYTCRYSTRKKIRLRDHILIHIGEKPCVCDICGSRFRTKCQLKRHRVKHTGEKPHVCDTCGSRFSEAHRLNIHKRIHSREKPYICDVCESSFKLSRALKEHKTIHSGQRPYICDVCRSRFRSFILLKKHKTIHTGDRPHVCDVCESRFIDTTSLKVHKRIHSGQKPFICDVCGSRFRITCNLNAHKKIHTGEKPYLCDVCGSRFITSSHLKRHKMMHTGEKPHVCDACGSRFNDAGNLKQHQRKIHKRGTGEKPYACDTCKSWFSKVSNLKVHKRIHTMEQP